MKVGSTNLNQCVLGCSAIVDSGTSLLVGPSQYVDQIISAVGTVNQDCSNWQQLPNVEFTINGQQYAITPVELREMLWLDFVFRLFIVAFFFG